MKARPTALRLVKRRHQPRICDNCGEPYWRRNMYEAWTKQNPGHRAGWQKVMLRVCTRCQNQARVTRSLMVVEASIVRALPPAANHHRKEA